MDESKRQLNPETAKILSIVMPEITAMEMAIIAIIKSHPDPKKLLESFNDVMAKLQVSSATSGGEVMSETRMFKSLSKLRDQIPD